MTDVLSPLSTTSAGPGSRGRPSRSVSVSAVLAALGTAGSALALTVGLGLAGWFAADAGRYGETTDAVRVGADAWLLAHGAGLRVGRATVTLLPLALTLLCALLAFRSGRWAARRSACPDLRSALAAVAIMTTTYATAALVVAVLAVHPAAESGLIRAFAGAATLMLLAGGTGVLVTAGPASVLASVLGGRTADWVWSVVRGSAAVVLLLLAAGAALLAGALVLDFGAAATVLSRLHADGPGGLLYTLVGAAFVPNAVILSGAYLLGPGFMIGTGTLVSPAAVVLGPVPAFPLLAALPSDGPTPSWAPWLVVVPALIAAVGAYLAGRRTPTSRYEGGAGRGLLVGLLAAVAFVVLALLASGSAGPGRMADVGVVGVPVLIAATLALGSGGLVGGAVATLVERRRVKRQASTAGTGAD